MSPSELYVSLDIGSSSVKVLIGEVDGDALHVIGVGNVQSKGIRKGTIIDIDATVSSIRKAVEQAERMTGMNIHEVVLGIPANSIQLYDVNGIIAINSDDREITDDDLDRVMVEAQRTPLPPEREIVNIFPKQFIVDDYSEIKDPRGMLGLRLEMEGTMITTSKTVLHNLLRCVERAGLSIREIYLQPLATGMFALTEDEKMRGTAYIDIGGGLTTISYFENNRLQKTSVVPLGGDNVTKDLSYVLQTPTEEARKIKHKYGHAFYDDASDDELFEVPIIGSETKEQFSQRYISEIIEVRLEELFDLILEEFYHMGIQSLPGGIVITGGITKIEGILPLARHVLQQRVRIYVPEYIGVREPMYATAVGLIQYAYQNDVFYGAPDPLEEQPIERMEQPMEGQEHAQSEAPQEGMMTKAKKWFNNFFE